MGRCLRGSDGAREPIVAVAAGVFTAVASATEVVCGEDVEAGFDGVVAAGEEGFGRHKSIAHAGENESGIDSGRDGPR